MAKKKGGPTAGSADNRRRYSIEVSAEQLDALISACELLGRVGAGQTFTIQDNMPELGESAAYDIRHHFQQVRYLTEEAITSDGRCTPQSRVSWDLYQVLRHRRAWDRDPQGGRGVDFDEPLARSGKELATIKAVE